VPCGERTQHDKIRHLISIGFHFATMRNALLDTRLTLMVLDKMSGSVYMSGLVYMSWGSCDHAIQCRMK
jgi:hypothetical protein